MTAFCANDRQGVISGDKGYIIVDNINNPQQAIVYSINHEEVARYTCPPQITGFEYQVQASIDAIREGKIETPYMPHTELCISCRCWMISGKNGACGIRWTK